MFPNLFVRATKPTVNDFPPFRPWSHEAARRVPARPTPSSFPGLLRGRQVPAEQRRRRAEPKLQPERAEGAQGRHQDAHRRRVDVRPLQPAVARPEDVAVLVALLRGQLGLQRPPDAPHVPHCLLQLGGQPAAVRVPQQEFQEVSGGRVGCFVFSGTFAYTPGWLCVQYR